MDINNIQALIAQGLLTDVASVDPNKAYVAVGVFQPGNRQSGPAGNAYPSYAMPISEFLSGAGVLTGVQNGLVLAGTLAELGGTLVHTTDVNINGYSMQFSNGVYPILFLDPGKQQVAIGGNNPKGMLDITATGSGTVGLQLNTASTQDAEIHFRTNNAATARVQVYVEDASQTLNVYTVNSDTIFWNGNGLVQSKTLTLFTNTTAKFESNLGIGVTSASNTRTHIQGIDSTSANYALKIDNSASSPLLYVRNDGTVGIGTILPTARLQVKSSAHTSGTYAIKIDDDLSNSLLKISNTSRVSINNGSHNSPLGTDDAIFSTQISGYTFQHAANILWLYDNNVKMYNAISSTYGAIGTYTAHDFYIRTNNADKIKIEDATGFVGINQTVLSAMLHVRGIDTTSSNYALKVDNSASSPLLHVRNDGTVGIGQAPTVIGVDILNNSVNAIFRLRSNTFIFDDHMRVDDNGSFRSTSSNAFGVGGIGTLYIDHAVNTLAANGQSYLHYTNAGGVNVHGIIGGNAGLADPLYRLKIYQDTTASVLQLISIGAVALNDGFDYTVYNANISSTGIITNAGSGTTYKVGVNLDIINADVNRAINIENGLIRVVRANQPAYGTLTSGEFYYDTAVNILANGDWVVGMKA